MGVIVASTVRGPSILRAAAVGALLTLIAAPAAAQTSLAGAGTAWQSSTCDRGEAWVAIDGIKGVNTTARAGASHTCLDDHAWWALDLGGLHAIERIDITAWTKNGFTPLRVSLHTVFDAALSATSVWFQDARSPSSLVFLPDGTHARYLKVQLLEKDRLHLSEVEVTGTAATATSSPEPITMVLLGSGLLGVAGVARRRRRTES